VTLYRFLPVATQFAQCIPLFPQDLVDEITGKLAMELQPRRLQIMADIRPKI